MEQRALDSRRIVDLFAPRAELFWGDLALCATIGWGAFAGFITSSGAPARSGFFVISTLALFRGLAFLHELSHNHQRNLPGFGLAWNALFGIPFCIPSILYSPHIAHHQAGRFGSDQDPEYFPLAQNPRFGLLSFLLFSFLFPVLLAGRFLLAAPLGWINPQFHRWTERKLSMLSINPKYVRHMTARERSELYVSEVSVFLFWIAAIYLGIRSGVGGKLLLSWYAVYATTVLLNQIRGVSSHYWQPISGQLGLEDQLRQSMTLEGGFARLIAPLNTRHHALHHYFPSLPYHSLPEAHERLLQLSPHYRELIRDTQRSPREVMKGLWMRDLLPPSVICHSDTLARHLYPRALPKAI